MIGYYMESAPDGRCIQVLAWEMPPQSVIEPAGPENTLTAIDAPPASWVGSTPTEALYMVDGVAELVETATLEQARALAWSAAKAARDAAEAADFEFGGVLYQPDVAKITGAVLAALLPRAPDDPFSINWTVSDNSVVTLDAAQVMALGLTLTARINAIHHRGRNLRALIDNAATPQEAYGHTWESLNAE